MTDFAERIGVRGMEQVRRVRSRLYTVARVAAAYARGAVVSAAAGALIVVACSDAPTSPSQPTTMPVRSLAAQVECWTFYFEGEVWELEPILDAIEYDEYDWWVTEWFYDAGANQTVITVCVEPTEQEPVGEGDPDPVDCSSTPWDPSCPPPPLPPECNPACGGGDPGGGGGGQSTPADSISVTVSADSATVGYGGTVRVTATVTANNGGGYTPEGWTWSGEPDTPCGTELVCEMTVIGSGWMKFTARKNAVTASDSVQITVNPLALAMACERLQGAGAPIRRGEGVYCHVADTTVFAGWTPTYLKWRFTPPANSWGLGVVEDTDAGRNFGGMVAIGGDVELSLRLERSGLIDTLIVTGAFAVEARDVAAFAVRGADELQAPAPYDVATTFPIVPDSLNVIGRTETNLTGGEQAMPINFGPNKGYRFLVGYALTYVHSITIPIPEFAVGGYYFNKAEDSPTDGSCSRSFVRDVVPGFVRAHEGVNREAGSHTGAAQDYLTANASAIRNRAESVVFTATTASAVSIYIMNHSAFDVAIRAPDMVPGYGTIPPPNGCRPRY